MDAETERQTRLLKREGRSLLAAMNPGVFAARVFAHGAQDCGVAAVEVVRHTAGTASPAVLQELYAELTGETTASAPRLALFRERFGKLFDPLHVKVNPGVPMAVEWEGRPAWLFWHPGIRSTVNTHHAHRAWAGGRLELVREPPHDQLVLGVLRQWGRENVHGCAAVLVDTKKRRYVATDGVDPRWIRWLRSTPRPRDEGVLPSPADDERGPHISFFARLPEGRLLFVMKPGAAGADGVRMVMSPVFWIGVLLLLSGVAPRMLASVGRLSVKGRFYALFAYVLVIPMIGVVLLAKGYLAQRERVFWEDQMHQLRSELLAIDEGFRQFAHQIPALMHRLLCLPCFRHFDLPAVRTLADRWVRDDLVAYCEVFREPEGTVYRGQTYAHDEAMRLLAEIGAEVCLGEGRAALRPGAEQKVTRADLLKEMMEKGGSFQFSDDRLEFYSTFGQAILTNYFAARCHLEGGSLWAVGIVFNKAHANREYLRQMLSRNRPVRLAMKDVRNHRWYGVHRPLPGMNELVLEAERTRQEQTALIETADGGILAMSMPPRYLQAMGMVGMVPMNAWESEVRTWKTQLVMLFLAALLIGIGGVNLLAGDVLTPLGALSQGVAALKTGNSRFRLPVTTTDEVGRLTEAFNHALENMRERELAGQVQEAGLVGDVPLPAGFTHACQRIVSAGLGGDFFDLQRLHDGRVGVFTGFVSGSGVGAAMVTALAKAAISHQVACGRDPEALLGELNRFLYECTDRRRTVGVACVTLGPPGTPVRVATAGHPHPLLYHRATKTLTWVGQNCFPLGRRPAFVGASCELALAEGDMIVITTDGLINTVDAAGVPFGYERVENVIRGIAEPTPSLVADQLEQAWVAYRRGVPASEDFTVCCLGRDAKETVHAPRA